MQRLACYLPIELSDHRRLAVITAEQAQLALELKQIALYERFRQWAPEEEVKQELRVVASQKWLQETMANPDHLLVGLWQHEHLQAVGALERKEGRLRVMSGFAWPTGFGIAAPMMKAGIRLARLTGETELWAFTARENLIGKAFLERHGFQYAGSLWRLPRPPHWVMLDYKLKL